MDTPTNEQANTGDAASLPRYNWPYIEKIYNAAAQVVIQLSDELSELKTKFGESSKLVIRKSEQLKAIVELYDSTFEALKVDRHLLRMAELVNFYRNVDMMSVTTGLTHGQIFDAMGGKHRKGTSLDNKLTLWYKQMFDALQDDEMLRAKEESEESHG